MKRKPTKKREEKHKKNNNKTKKTEKRDTSSSLKGKSITRLHHASRSNAEPKKPRSTKQIKVQYYEIQSESEKNNHCSPKGSAGYPLSRAGNPAEPGPSHARYATFAGAGTAFLRDIRMRKSACSH